MNSSEYPCFIIPDLSKDPRFASLPVVNGTVASYRFYAGTPIRTSNEINLGSLFLFDDKPREGLTLLQRKFLHEQAANVVRHLETKREASERRRGALMSKGIATFLERASYVNTPISTKPPAGPSTHLLDEAHQIDEKRVIIDDPNNSSVPDNEKNETRQLSTTSKQTQAQETVLDKIRSTLDHAAEILRESLELAAGGVAFFDTSVGYSGAEPGSDTLPEKSIYQDDSSQSSRLQAGAPRIVKTKELAKVLAVSTSASATWDSEVLTNKTLLSMITSYPKGKIWYLNEDYSPPALQINPLESTNRSWPLTLPILEADSTQGEALYLSTMFHGARQVILMPLWDAAGDRWYSGCLVWNQSPVPVFTDSEISYLSTFTSSVMVEISRLDAIIANKMKSDFISSISHEFRSPLHGKCHSRRD